MRNFKAINKRLKELKEKVYADKGTAIAFIEYDGEIEKLTLNDNEVNSEQELYEKVENTFKGHSKRVIIVDFIPQHFIPWVEKLEVLEND